MGQSQLIYSYYDNSNKLSRVYDPIPSNRYGSDAGDVPDIDFQAENNYQYDKIGNLIKDNAEGITNIKWSVYGKILEISRTPGGSNPVNKIVYTYDAQGNRISKALHKSNGTISYTWYVRDAQGNTLATYQSSGSSISNLYELPLKLSERHLYGSSRLGIYSATVDVDNGPRNMSYENAIKYIRGLKQYELTNHLGNVLATITDKKKGIDTNSDGFIDHYDADITTAQDYYPFGMLMPSRIGYQTENGWPNEPGGGGSGGDVVPENIAIDSRVNNAPPEYTATNSIELNPGFQSGSGDAFLAYISEAEQGSGGSSGNNSSLSNGYYRYGFNGKENDNEVKGVGNQQDYGMRIYDPRIGRFLSVDPIAKDYPELTPYQFASNTPIQAVDIDGEEGEYSMDSENQKLKRQGEAMLKQLDYRYNSRSLYQVPQATLSQAKPVKNEYELARQAAVNKREFEKVGRNPDGTPKPITKLLNNKTYKSFSENLAMPLIEGYSLFSGLGELRAIYKAISYMGKREFASLATEGLVNPKTIRFSQNSISETFKNKEDIQLLINSLKRGDKIDIPPIRLVEKDGLIYSLDNRRLYAYKEAGVQVPYIKLDKIPNKELGKFTTVNNGTSIEVRKTK